MNVIPFPSRKVSHARSHKGHTPNLDQSDLDAFFRRTLDLASGKSEIDLDSPVDLACLPQLMEIRKVLAKSEGRRTGSQPLLKPLRIKQE